MKNNLQKLVTDRILDQLKNGVVPWKKPWSGYSGGVFPRNAVTKRGYSGVNVVLLWITAQERGYTTPLWLTYKQASEAGGQVKRGEKSTVVIYASAYEKENDQGETRNIPFLKSFNVFNVAQIEGLQLEDTAPRIQNKDERDAIADAFMRSTGADIRHGESRAYFRRKDDFIMLPDFGTFTSSDAYYATAFHELTHWSGAENRLNRDLGKRFGDHSYAAEELVAELGSSFICAEFGIDCEGQDSAYIASWIKLMTDHESAIVAAASAASKAVEFMRSLAVAEAA